jgi:hypothetical protein
MSRRLQVVGLLLHALALSLVLLPEVEGVKPQSSLSVNPKGRIEELEAPHDHKSAGHSLYDFVAPVRTTRPHGEDNHIHGRIREIDPIKYRVAMKKHRRHKRSSLAYRKGSSTKDDDAASQLVTGWVLVHGLGNHTDVVQQPQVAKLTRAVRDSVADVLGTCRAAVSITDVRSINVKLYEDSLLSHEIPTTISLSERARNTVMDWIFGHRQVDSASTNTVNLTQLKLWYEVRIVKEMEATQQEMADRVESLQIYTRFVDAGKLLSQSFIRTGVDFGSIIVLDDLGPSSVEKAPRHPLDPGALLDCTEEMLLRHARFNHQYAVAAALLLAGFTACAGSAMFGMKQHSHIPSRFNMLSRDMGT